MEEADAAAADAAWRGDGEEGEEKDDNKKVVACMTFAGRNDKGIPAIDDGYRCTRTTTSEVDIEKKTWTKFKKKKKIVHVQKKNVKRYRPENHQGKQSIAKNEHASSSIIANTNK